MRCPHCGAENVDTAQFCGSCGERLEAREAVQGVPDFLKSEAMALAEEHDTLPEAKLPVASRPAHFAPVDEPVEAVAEEELPAEDVAAELLDATPDADADPAAESAPANALDDEATRLFDELPTNEARRLAEERARREEEERLARETKIAQASTDLDEPDEWDDAATADPDATVLAAPEAGDDTVLVPGVIPVNETMLRVAPVDRPEPEFVVRNTRDYDHDAQSANVAASVENFDTIVEGDAGRDSRRDPYARSSKRGDVPGEGNSRSKLRPLLAMLVIALVLGGGGAVLSYGMELWGGRQVPSLVGDSQANAELALADKGLKAKVIEQPADDAIGKVVEQAPQTGERVPEGSTVTITVAVNRLIPEVVGLSQDEARAALEAAGAEHIVVVTKPSSKKEGTVVAVSPEEGRTFVSRSDVMLTVAGPYTVPDVLGKKEKDAVDAIRAAGLEAEVSYVKSDETVRTVVKTEPAAGETIKKGGTVKVQVSTPYPSDPYHLAEFFDHSSQDVDGYLRKHNFSFERGVVDNLGNAVALYKSIVGEGTITFSSQPYQTALKIPSEGSSNVLSTGAPIAGVRLDLPAAVSPSTVSRDALNGLVADCGLTGMSDVCDNTTITVPSGTKKIAATFMCGSGSMGGLNWTALLVSLNGKVTASVTCFKDGLYASAGLGTFNGSLCQFEAYQEVYLNSAYQVKEEKKKDDKKDSKDSKDSKDKDSDKKDADEAKDDEAKDTGNDNQQEGATADSQETQG